MPQRGITIDDQTIEDIQELADINNRSFSEMAAMLLKDAVKALDSFTMDSDVRDGLTTISSGTRAEMLGIRLPIKKEADAKS